MSEEIDIPPKARKANYRERRRAIAKMNEMVIEDIDNTSNNLPLNSIVETREVNSVGFTEDEIDKRNKRLEKIQPILVQTGAGMWGKWYA